MRCGSCDKNLSDFEATRKIETTDKIIVYPDLCNRCFKESGLSSIVTVIERSDLRHEEEIEKEFQLYDE